MKDVLQKALAVLLIVIFAVVFDQVTKIWAENNFASVRYPDHQIEVTVEPEMDGLNIDKFVTEKYGASLDEEAALRVKSSATRAGKRLTGVDTLKAGDTVSFGHMSRTVNPYWDYIYARNPGAAFSFMANQSETTRSVFFGITGLIALIALSGFIVASEWKKKKFLIITLACILGGALGNIIDRVRLRYVIDFISWHVGEATWPTFNIADVFVTGGIALLVIELIVHRNDYNEEKKDQADESDQPAKKSAASLRALYDATATETSKATEPPTKEAESVDANADEDAKEGAADEKPQPEGNSEQVTA